MRVGLVTPRYPPTVAGGGEISAQLLAEQLSKHDRISAVTVLSFDGNGTDTRHGIEVRRLANLSSTITEWQNLRAYRKLREHVSEFDLLHAYNMELHPVVGFCGTKFDIETVATLNSYHFLPHTVTNTQAGRLERLYELVGFPTTGRLLRRSMQRIDSFIAISSAIRDLYTEYGFEQNAITVIPNMLDPSFSIPDLDATPGITVLYVGEVAKIKGVDHLVRAMQALPEEYHLRIVGDGSLVADLKSLVTDLDLEDRVTLTGYVDYSQIPTEYAKADVFVHPGVWPEPFGRTLIEAMQASLPVVCTDIGGPVDIVQDPTLRCEPGEPAALATAIERACQNPEQIGRENREYVENNYAPPAVVSQIVAVYERLTAS